MTLYQQQCDTFTRDMVIIGTDAIPDALQVVKDGRLTATVLQDAVGQASILWMLLLK